MNPIYKEAGRVLDECKPGKITKVIKVARSGATTGIIANSIDRGETFVLVAPTLRIAHEVANNAIKYSKSDEQKTEVMRIHSTRECEMVQKQIKDHPMLAHLAYIPKDSCKGCEAYQDCPVTRFIRVDDDTVVGFGMTYAKFMVMIEAQKDDDGEVQNCLLNCLTNNFFDVDTIIFDEAHQIEEDTLVDSVEVNGDFIVDELVRIADNIDKWAETTDEVATSVAESLDSMLLLVVNNSDLIEDMAEEGKANEQRLITTEIENIYQLGLHKFFKHYMKFIKDIKANNLYTKEEVIFIESCLNILKSPTIIVQYIYDDEGVHINYGTKSKLQTDIRDMLETCHKDNNNRRVIFTSATFSDTQDYKNTFGDYDIVRMEDIMETNKSMTLIADIRQLDSMNMFNKQPKFAWAIKRIEKILKEKPGLPVITVKKKVAQMLYMRLKADGFETSVDYYRSVEMIGVDNPLREAIFVGMPVAPMNTFDVISKNYIDSQTRRTNQNHAAFYQAINRFKDPQGKDKSIIHCVGIKSSVLKSAISWADAREVNFNVTDKRYRYKDIRTVDSTRKSGFGGFDGYLFMEPFELMNIEKIAAPVSEKRPYAIITNSIYYLLSPLKDVNRYGEPVFALHTEDYRNLFISDVTKVFAKQSERGGYYATKSFINDGMIDMHRKGALTLGVYPKSWDGTTKVSCIDIDTHGDEDPADAEEKLIKVMNSLNTHGIKFVLEESSPNSYHILMFYDEGTPTEAVYYLMKDVIQYAGYPVRGSGKIEMFPNKPNPYNPKAANKNIGVQFRLPLGKHQVKKTWSRFIDPITRDDIIIESVYIMDLSKTDFKKVELKDDDFKPIEIEPVALKTGHGYVYVSVKDAYGLLGYRMDGDSDRGQYCPFCGRKGDINSAFLISSYGAHCFSCKVHAHDALALVSKSKNITRHEARLWLQERVG